MGHYNILYIEDSIGVGGSLASLCTLIESLNFEKYKPFCIVYHPNQEEYLHSRCGPVRTLVSRPRSSLKSTLIGRGVLKWSALVGEPARRGTSFCLFLADFFTNICPYVFQLYLTVRRWNIHLVHLNTGICIPGTLLAWFLGVPCIATQRGPEWLSPIIRFFSMGIKFLMANSLSTKKDLLKLGVDQSKITVIYPPVNLNTFDYRIDCSAKRIEFGLRPEEISFGIIGMIAVWKGHRIFLNAAAQVLKIIPECRIFVIGDTPDGTNDYKDELISLTETLGIRQKVAFTGFRQDVPELIQLLDIAVLASIEPEPFGKVIIEAMAMKKPVIATNMAGPTEIIADGIDGFLIPPNDPKELAKKIVYLIKHRDLARNIGEAAWHKVKRQYSTERHINEVEQIYDSILSSDS